MPHEFDTIEEESLWNCLHDGSLESLTSDLFARLVTVVFDVPYIWNFHHLPASTRFRLVLGGVRLVGVLDFKPWPDQLVVPQGASWEQSEDLRQRYRAKGRLESLDWQLLAAKLQQDNDYEISNAAVTRTHDGSLTLKLQLTDYETDFPEVRITAETLRFFLGEHQELSVHEFLALGEAYWEAFANRSTNH